MEIRGYHYLRKHPSFETTILKSNEGHFPPIWLFHLTKKTICFPHPIRGEFPNDFFSKKSTHRFWGCAVPPFAPGLTFSEETDLGIHFFKGKRRTELLEQKPIPYGTKGKAHRIHFCWWGVKPKSPQNWSGWWQLKDFWNFAPRTLGKMISNLTSICFRWVGSTTNQQVMCYVWISLECLGGIFKRMAGCLFFLVNQKEIVKPWTGLFQTWKSS